MSTTDQTTDAPAGGLPYRGWAPIGETADGSYRSTPSKWIPGVGQAFALNGLAAARTAATGKSVKRVHLIREVVDEALATDPMTLRNMRAVPPTPHSAPPAERQVTWIPARGTLAQLDHLADQVGIDRNNLLRRAVGNWLLRQPDLTDELRELLPVQHRQP